MGIYPGKSGGVIEPLALVDAFSTFTDHGRPRAGRSQDVIWRSRDSAIETVFDQ